MSTQKVQTVVVVAKTSSHQHTIGSVMCVKHHSGGQYFPCESNGCNTANHSGGYLHKGDFIPVEDAKGNDALKGHIAELQENLDILVHVYETGEQPISPQAKKKAALIMETIKSIQSNDDAAALTALTTILNEC